MATNFVDGFILFSAHFVGKEDVEVIKLWIDSKVKKEGALKLFEDCLAEMNNSANAYPYRKKAYEVSAMLYRCYNEIAEVYFMAEVVGKMAFADRFIRRDKMLPIFSDEYDRPTPPVECGLYLVGDVKCNPITFDPIYLIKVGCGQNLAKRVKDYCTENPLAWFADFLIVGDDIYKEMEAECHEAIKEVALARFANTKEWFVVDRETYFKICNEGFHYFFDYKD